MNDTRFFSADNMKRKILPFLYTTLITSAMINVFYGDYFNFYSAAGTALTVIFFAVYDKIAARKKLGPLIYILLGFFLLILVSLIMSTAPRGMWFTEWFLTGGETVDTIPQFIFTVIIAFSFFFSSVVYYFTHIIYRVSVLTLIGLIPCAVYIKASQIVPAAYAVLIAAFNIFLYVYQNRQLFAAGHISRGKAAEISAYIDFAVAAVLLAVILPKPAETPFYDKFEEFTSMFSFGGRRLGVSGEYMSHSGNADDYQDMESKLLYLVSTSYPQYLKIQTYDIYEPENRWWVYGSDATTGYKNWEEKQAPLSLTSLISAYAAAEDPALADIPEERLRLLLSEEDIQHSAVIRAVDYPASFASVPQRVTGITFQRNPRYFTYRSGGGEVWPSTHSVGANDSYTVTYYDSEYARNSGFLTSGLCDIDYSDFGHNLYSVYWSVADSELEDTVSAFIREHANAEKYSPENYAPVSDELQRVADEITAGLRYDYEKAAAIEDFFYNNGFTYDLAYKAPEENDTPEFFINESRRGTCSDFATAFCLLARAAGLRVRYAEGFTGGSQQEDAAGGLFQIYTENAHAYPEVYIPGAGWVIYEPTVSGANNASAGGGLAAADTVTIAVTVAVIAVLIGIFVLLALMFPVADEKLFRLRVRFSSPEKGVIMLYGRFAKHCARIFGVNSAVMTAEQITLFTLEKTETSPEALVSVFERVCYGKGTADKNELDGAYKCYKDCVKLLKKAGKPRGKFAS